MNKFTTDNPNGNLETMLNFAYAKNGDVWLRGADDGKDVELCAYIAKRAFYLELCGITNKDDVVEACGSADCFCELGALFAAATQAAELRARLAAYEDTGLEPEEIRHMADIFDEYVRATEEGRLVVLPCKIGDTVYWVHGRSVLPVHILWFETNAYGWCACGTYPPMATPTFKFEDFGKTVFLTREGAEKALDGMNNDER